MLQSHFKKQVERFQKQFVGDWRQFMAAFRADAPQKFIVEMQQETIQVLREKIEEYRDEVANESIDLCENSQTLRNLAVKRFDDLLNFIGSEK